MKPRRHVAGEAGSGAAFKVTANQRQIVLSLFAGMRESEIAAQTGRKPSTIGNTVRLVRKLLGARSEYDLMRECLRLGIVEPAEIYALAERRKRRASSGADRCGRG